MHLKEEAADYLQADTIRSLVKKYSQFINFPIYMWASHTETVEEPEDEPAPADDADEDAQVGASRFLLFLQLVACGAVVNRNWSNMYHRAGGGRR